MKTIAQTYIDQGYELGRQEMEQEVQKAQHEIQRAKQETQKARQETQRLGLLASIELGLELKFGKEGLGLTGEVRQIQEMSLRIIIRSALKFVSDLGELRSIYQPPLASS